MHKSKCNGNGICWENTCSCYPGYEGDACDIMTSAHPIVGTGNLQMRRMFLRPEYEGEDCSKKSSCKDECSGSRLRKE